MDSIGHLEEVVLLLVLCLDEAYGVSVADEYHNQLGSKISIPAVHTVLRRLENKGLLTSEMGEPSPQRGGRRKRTYQATKYGLKTIDRIRKNRLRLWSKIPELRLGDG